ncbi:hypothetical protein Sango_1132900 [Sesamum angolense]|uniref:Uncharacterized protein n=1 Tax=Sesamum angolense TaxID=2727404 RepID=A0AAE1WV44_9LAMI|nr:hypothetical protein Sango_1132900 [Sesamum angolense]
MIETAAKTGVQGRIVNVSSSIHSWFSGDIIRYLALITKNKSEYDGTRAYALSKLANVLHTNELSRRLTASSGDDLLCGHKPKSGEREWEILFGLQRSIDVEIGIQLSRSCEVMGSLRGDGLGRSPPFISRPSILAS